MTKWEYLQVMMTTRPVREGHGRLIVLGSAGHHVQVGVGTRLIDLMCDLGRDGWELSGVVEMSSTEEAKSTHDIHLSSSSFIFKRPLDE